VKHEWISTIEEARDRAEVIARVEKIKQTASGRFEAMLEEVGGGIVREMQAASERLQTQALQMVRAQYKSRRTYDDEASPVVIEMLDALESPSSGVLETAMDVFEKRRVEVGIGGAAAGATLGTAILPGIGTALGAVVGVFAGFLEGTSSLKNVCVAKVHVQVDQVEKLIALRFATSEKEFASDIRRSVEAMLEQALHLREKSILRVIDVERSSWRCEHEKLASVTELLAALRESERRLLLIEGETSRELAASR
jgi:hypothetical protein